MRSAINISYGLIAGLLFTANPSMSFAGFALGGVSPTSPELPSAQLTTSPSPPTGPPPPTPLPINPPINPPIPPKPKTTFTVNYAKTDNPFLADVSALLKPEPSIEYRLTATNNSLSDEFLLLALGTYIFSQGLDVQLQNDLTVTVSGSGPISLTPTYDGVNASAGLQRQLLSTDGGQSFDMNDEYGPLGTSITTAGTTVYSTSLPPVHSTLIYDYLELLVGFNLSPGTTVTLDGSISINAIPNPIPEPSTLVLSSIAAFMFVGFKLRSRVKPRVS